MADAISISDNTHRHMTLITSKSCNTKFHRADIIRILSGSNKLETLALTARAARIRRAATGTDIYLRGLIELSNICSKNCFYCGIRAGNTVTGRYMLSTEQIMQAATYAIDRGFGSLVIQSGERTDRAFTGQITDIVQRINHLSRGEIGITLSCGEQDRSIYEEWRHAGASRYLLRIESSSPELYSLLHPHDGHHGHARRMEALQSLKELGYQTGTGVMIGLPFQTAEHLADDLLFMKEFDIDMAGMGPYIPHPDTPLYAYRDDIPAEPRRLELSLKMIALLRILMPDINIAASTALSALHPDGRAKAVAAGANVYMPNITPVCHASQYMLYEGKPMSDDGPEAPLALFEEQTGKSGYHIAYGKRGDSLHYRNRNKY